MWIILAGVAVLAFALLKNRPTNAGTSVPDSASAPSGPQYYEGKLDPKNGQQQVDSLVSSGFSVTTYPDGTFAAVEGGGASRFAVGKPPASVNTAQGAPLVTRKASSVTAGYFKGIK